MKKAAFGFPCKGCKPRIFVYLGAQNGTRLFLPIHTYIALCGEEITKIYDNVLFTNQ